MILCRLHLSPAGMGNPEFDSRSRIDLPPIQNLSPPPHPLLLSSTSLLQGGLIALLLPWASLPSTAQETGAHGFQAPVAEATPETEKSSGGLALPDGFQATLFAAEPLMANPVAFCFDEQGRCFVAETYRQETAGVPDNRAHRYWIPDDLAAQTVADRRAMYLKHHPEYAEAWTRQHDLIRRLVDSDGDGRADLSTVYADGFNDLLDGTGAGLLAVGDSLYYTCIPHLWRLQDADGDGAAESRESLHYGYGVRVALRGHDLHGLTLGPDGWLYFSIGDRGYHLELDDRTLADPGSGAVFRCRLDGSGLEIFATGLRNPQELAFDDFGNLFTGDNNCDAGDRARFLYLVEGGETGWRMNFQYRGDRGPWMPEKWWWTRHPGQAAFLIPPIAHVGSGPSGLVHYPGTGFPDEFQNNFFLCDFLGGRSHSSVRRLQVEPEGAGYRLVKNEVLIGNVLATDVDFGPDSAMYVSDWVAGWTGTGRGRLHRIRPVDFQAEAAIAETKSLLAADFSTKTSEALALLLNHRDQRLRLKAQFTLAARGATAAPYFQAVAEGRGKGLGRLHAIWGLGQLAANRPALAEPLVSLCQDPYVEARAQSCKVLGEVGYPPAYPQLIHALRDDSARVRYFAALALGKLGKQEALPAIMAMVEANEDRDLYLRHAGVMACTWIGAADAVQDYLAHPSAAVRMVVLLAQRRWQDPGIAAFLNDPEPLLQIEAARAIYDGPILEAFPALAATLNHNVFGSDQTLLEPWIRRAVAANDRLSQAEHAEALAAFAANPQAAPAYRAVALRNLRDWLQAPATEQVLNLHWPRPERQRQDLIPVLEGLLPKLLAEPTGTELQALAAETAGRFSLRSCQAPLLELSQSAGAAPKARVAALQALRSCSSDGFAHAVQALLDDGEPQVRSAAARALSELEPEAALEVLDQALAQGSSRERQLALRTLTAMKNPEADRLLLRSWQRWQQNQWGDEVLLELIDAAEQRGQDHPPLAEALTLYQQSWPEEGGLAPYRFALFGGNAAEGHRIFLEKAEVECQRCHALGEAQAAAIGPALDGIAARQNRKYFLQSIVSPNEVIAEGYESVLIMLKGGKDVQGRLLQETENALTLEVLEGEKTRKVEVSKDQVRDRFGGLSAMPANLSEFLNREELRDLVEFLASLKE